MRPVLHVYDPPVEDCMQQPDDLNVTGSDTQDVDEDCRVDCYVDCYI